MKNKIVSSKSKHYDEIPLYLWDSEMIKKNEIVVDYMLTTNMVADPLTKGIFGDLFSKHIT